MHAFWLAARASKERVRKAKRGTRKRGKQYLEKLSLELGAERRHFVRPLAAASRRSGLSFFEPWSA
jgi:hypothetical protein